MSTSDEEDDFENCLARFASRSIRDARRSDITAVLNALRCGLTVDELLQRAPGLNPRRLNDAYRYLDGLRTCSVAAWNDIVDEPTPDVFARRSRAARLLLPHPVAILSEISRESSREFATMTKHLQDEVRLADDAVAAIEARIAATPGEAGRLGRLLFDADGTGIANWPMYLPRRVGMLSPVRAAALLGERTDRSQFESVRAASRHLRGV